MRNYKSPYKFETVMASIMLENDYNSGTFYNNKNLTLAKLIIEDENLTLAKLIIEDEKIKHAILNTRHEDPMIRRLCQFRMELERI